MKAKITFYNPKSLSASIIGVVINMVLLALPMVLMALYQSNTENPSWFLVLVGLPIGIFLMYKSEPIVYPLVGVKHEFIFSPEFVEIISPNNKEKIALKDLKITAFEAHLEGGSVKHLVLEWDKDKKIDIFDTWVTSNSTGDFHLVFGKHLLTDS